MSCSDGSHRIEWRKVTLGDVCQIQLGKMLSPASKKGIRPIAYLRNANVQWGRFDLRDVSTMDFDERQEAKLSLRPGDLLVCEGGEPGRAAVWNGEIERCCYQKALHRLRPIDEQIDPHFVMYRLWLAAFDGEFTASTTKSTIAHLPAVRLTRLEILLPPPEEQRRIAARLREQLSTLAEARAALESQLASAASLPTAHLRVVFESENGQSWPRKKVAEVCEIIPGRHIVEQDHNRAGRGVPYITGPSDFGERQAVATRWTLKPDVMCRPNDILVTVKGAGVAKLNFAPTEPACIGRQLMAVRCAPEMMQPNFIFLALHVVQERLRKQAMGATVPGLSIEHLANLEIQTPTIDVQYVMSAQLDETFATSAKLQTSLRAKLAELEKLPAALLRAAFSANGG